MEDVSLPPLAPQHTGEALVRVSDVENSGQPQGIDQEANASSTSVHTIYESIVHVHSLSIEALCRFIDDNASLASANIVTTSCYSQIIVGVKHRFLILELSRGTRKTLWLRLDRRTDPMTGALRFLLNLGETPAHDVAQMASERGALLGGARVKQENEQIFETPPSLRDLRHLLHATYRELTRYKLWKENCWMFVALVQEHLAQDRKCMMAFGVIRHPELVPQVRPRINVRIQIELDLPSLIAQIEFFGKILMLVPYLWEPIKEGLDRAKELSSSSDLEPASVFKMEALAFTLSNLSERKVQISIIPKLAVKFFRQLQSRHSARNAAALVDALSVSYAGESAEDSARRLEERSLLAKFWLSHHLGGSSAPHSASPDKRLRTLRHISALLNVELPLNADFAWVQDHFHNPPLSRHSPSDPLSRARLGLSGLNAIGHHVRVLDRVPRPFTSSTLANSHDPAASLAIFQAVTINDSSSVALLAKAIALLRRNIRKGRQGSGVHQRPIEANDLWRFIYLLGRLGESLWVAGDVEEALSSYAEAIFAVKAFRAAEWPPPNCHDPTSGKQLIAEILFGYGASLFGCRRYLRAARVFMEAFELYQTVPDRDGRNQSSCRTAHAVSLYYSGDAISAVQAHDEVVKNWRQRQKDFGISDTGLHIVNANQPYCLHDFGRALELLECHREACLAYGEAIVLVSQDLINGLASAGRNDDFDKYVGRRVREWHIWSRTYPLVKSLVLLGHCFLDSNRRTDAATAYQHAIDLVTLLESKYPDDFPQFEALWSVSRALGVGWGQTCVEALKSLRVRVNVGADTKGDSSIGAPSINSNNGAHADVRDLQVALDGIQYFALRWWPPSPEGGEDISWGPQLDGRL